MLSVFYAEYLYSEYRYAEYHYTEYRYAECHYTKCHGTVFLVYSNNCLHFFKFAGCSIAAAIYILLQR